jgi:hypothetical protein
MRTKKPECFCCDTIYQQISSEKWGEGVAVE